MIASPEKLEGESLESWKLYIKRTFSDAIDWSNLPPDSISAFLESLSDLALSVVSIQRIWSIDDETINQELVWFLLNRDVTVDMVVAALNNRRENPLSKLQAAVIIKEDLVDQLGYQELAELDKIRKIRRGDQLKQQPLVLDPDYLTSSFSNLQQVKDFIIQGDIRVLSDVLFALAVYQVAMSARASNYA